MDVVILAGGRGTRMGSLTKELPKPMVELCGRPMLLHITDYYIKWGARRFIICCGYKAESFFDYFSIDRVATNAGGEPVLEVKYSGCTLVIVDTGIDTGTAGRVARIRPYIHEENFCLTYGDGLSDVHIGRLLHTHEASGKLVTITTVHPKERFGIVKLGKDNCITSFQEKSECSANWINGGFMVLKNEFFDHIASSDRSLERDCFPRLVQQKKMGAYCHRGFWQCMDTIEEKNDLEALIIGDNAPWLI